MDGPFVGVSEIESLGPTNNAMARLLRKAAWAAITQGERICLARACAICFGVIMRVLGPACSAEFLRYSYNFLAFSAIMQ
jgi:hypothetical protein